jgi:hypothetical protein
MRPEKAKYVVQRGIDLYVKEGSNALLYTKECERAIEVLDKKKRAKYARDGWDYDNRDPRTLTNYETGAYGEMFYISDRFMAPHRLNFLLLGIKEKLFNNLDPETYWDD